MLQKITANEIKIGMFVADLDRPWMDTPFLLQGFMLEDAEQVAQVREHCQWVMIDPLRSIGPEFERRPVKKAPPPRRDLGKDPLVVVHRTETPKVSGIEALRNATGNMSARSSSSSAAAAKAEPASATKSKLGEFAIPISQRTVDEDSDSGKLDPKRTSTGLMPGRDTIRKESSSLKGLFSQLKADVKNLFLSQPKENFDFEQYEAANLPKAEAIRPTFIPETVELTIYEDKQTVESEIGVATNAFAKTQELLHNVVQDIRSGNNMRVEVIESVIEDMVDSMVRNPDAMMWVARLREQDTMTYDHGLSVAINLVAFGRHLGFPKEQLSQLGVVGLLLDIGKIRVSREILEKNTQLSAAEFTEMKSHVTHSIDILNQTANVNPDVLEGVAQHHERMDGSGYPFGLPGTRISIFGKMAAIADTYAAITKKRPYAEPASPHDALQMLSNWSGTQFQSDMVEHFIQSIGVFPVGSLVELSTGEVAVVVTHNKQKRLRPKVLIVTEEDKILRKHPTIKDLIYDVSENPIYIRRGLPSNSYGIDPNEYYLS
jgi:HD-GYP domain-containing protein (c-di-GMP phosphodiesterase class II)